MFHALRYKNGGEICVVTGPITKPSYHYGCNLMVPLNEFPVICCGLVSASHLNGELGEVREITHDGMEFECGYTLKRRV